MLTEFGPIIKFSPEKIGETVEFSPLEDGLVIEGSRDEIGLAHPLVALAPCDMICLRSAARLNTSE